MDNTNYILSILDAYTFPDANDIGTNIASDFRRRRLEKNFTREQVADMADVPVSNIVRFEQKGLISLTNLIRLAVVMGYLSEIKNIFSQPKYNTVEELEQIKNNANKKRAYRNGNGK